MTTFPGAQPIPPGYTYAGPRPQLDPRSRRGARAAGMVGFGLLTLGWDLIVTVLVLAVLGFLFVGILSQITDQSITSQQSFDNTFAGFNGPAWVTGFIIAAVVGVVLWVLGIVLSLGILKAHGVGKPGAVTWAGFGIAVVISWFVDSIVGAILLAVASAIAGANPTTNGADPGPAFWVLSVVFAIFTAVASLFIGWLAWLWMAIATRPRTAPTPAPSVAA